MSKCNDIQTIANVLNGLITCGSSIKPLMDAVLRFNHIDKQSYSFDSKAEVLRNIYIFLTSSYEFKEKKGCNNLWCRLKLEYIGDLKNPNFQKKLKGFHFDTSIKFHPSNGDIYCDNLEPSSMYDVTCSIANWNSDFSEISLEIENFKHLCITAGKVIFTSREEDNYDYDKDFMHTYYIKCDEPSYVYVEVHHKGKLIGTIEFFEFLDVLSNREYNKLVLCKFSSFKESAIKNSKIL